MPSIWFQNTLVTSRGHPVPISSHCPSLSPSRSQPLICYPSLWSYLFWMINVNGIIHYEYEALCVWHDIFEVNPRCCMFSMNSSHFAEKFMSNHRICRGPMTPLSPLTWTLAVSLQDPGWRSTPPISFLCPDLQPAPRPGQSHGTKPTPAAWPSLLFLSQSSPLISLTLSSMHTHFPPSPRLVSPLALKAFPSPWPSKLLPIFWGPL